MKSIQFVRTKSFATRFSFALVALVLSPSLSLAALIHDLVQRFPRMTWSATRQPGSQASVWWAHSTLRVLGLLRPDSRSAIPGTGVGANGAAIGFWMACVLARRYFATPGCA